MISDDSDDWVKDCCKNHPNHDVMQSQSLMVVTITAPCIEDCNIYVVAASDTTHLYPFEVGHLMSALRVHHRWSLMV